MPCNQIVSRRHLLLTMLMLFSSSVAISDDAPPRITPVAASLLPVPSRSLRLKPELSGLSQTLVTAVSAAPDGDIVAVAGDDHAIRLIATDSLRVLKTLKGHRDLIKTLAFDRTGDKMASAGIDGQLIIWDRKDNYRVLQKMKGAPALACIRFAPDGNEIAAVGFDRRVYVIGRGDKQMPKFQCDCNDLKTVAYRDDNEVLAVAGRSGSLYLFDVVNGDSIGEYHIHQGRIHCMDFLPDSNLLVCVAEDGIMTVFDTRNGKVFQKNRITTGKLFSVAIIDSQHVAVGGSDDVIRVVNTTNGNVVRRLNGHKGTVSTLCSAGENLFSGGYDATLRRWGLSAVMNKARIAEGNQQIDR